MMQYIFQLQALIHAMPTPVVKQSSPLHLIGCFDDPFAGAERKLPDLAQALAGRRDTFLWSDAPPHPWYAERGARHIRPFAQQFPKGGMLVFSGVHVRPGVWLPHANPERLAVRYNLPNHGRLFDMIETLREATGLDPELLFVSRALQTSVGLPGAIEPSLIQLSPFLQMPIERPTGRPFTIGRVSRDVPEKHHPEDPALYRMLVAMGMRVRIMGGTCLRDQLGDVAGVELLPAGAEPVPAFLGSLDAMFYRTGSFYEAYGRVVFEAMASGLPVVASVSGGYAEWIGDGEVAVLIRHQEQALQVLNQLAQQPALRSLMGHRSRARALQLHGDQATQEMLAYYLA